MDPDDTIADLFHACGNGNPQAWEQLLVQYGPPMRLIALRVVRRFGLQRDLDTIVQDFWSDLYQRRAAVFHGFEPRWPGSELAYLKVVAANGVSSRCRQMLRHSTSEIQVETLPEPAPRNAAAPGPQVTVEDAARILEKELTPVNCVRDLAVFNYHYRAGWTSAEIAALRPIGLTESGVEAVLVRCRKILRSILNNPAGPRRDSPGFERYSQEEGHG